jgi:hypothetical protein
MSIDLFSINANSNNYLETATINQGLEYKEKQNRLVNLANQKNLFYSNSTYSQPDSLIESFVEGMDGNTNTNTGGAVATLPPNNVVSNNALNIITEKIMTSTDPAIQAQQQKYQNLLNQYNTIQTQYESNLRFINQDTKDYISATSPTNGYLNSFIRLKENGLVCYVTSAGVLRWVPNQDILNSISSKNGCPTVGSVTKLNNTLKKSLSGKYAYTQNPDKQAVFNIEGLYGATNMKMNEACGNEGKNVRVVSAWDNPKVSYQGTFSRWDLTDGTKYKAYSDTNYNVNSCMNKAIDDGVSTFGLTNYNNNTGLADCITMNAKPSVSPDQENATCSSSYYVGSGKTVPYPDGKIYGNTNGVAIYQTPYENIGTVNYVGVFRDEVQRALPLINGSNGLSYRGGGDYNHTYETCLKYAAGGNKDGPSGSPVYYKLFGLQNGQNGGQQTQCAVSNETNPLRGYARYGQIRPVQTGIKGKDGRMYGGGWQNAMFDTQTGSFLGIYGDSEPRAANHLAGNRDNNNVNDHYKCRKYAMDHNYKYFGLQYFDSDRQVAECWTTNDSSTQTGYARYGRQDIIPRAFNGAGSSNPSMNPVGFPNPIYGGPWQNAVYSIDYQNITPESYIGCYNNNPPGTQSPMIELAEFSSNAECSRLAQKYNLKYYGLRYGGPGNGSPSGPGKAMCLGTNDPNNYNKFGTYSSVFKNNEGNKAGNLYFTSSYKMDTGSSVLPSNKLIGSTAFIDQNGTLNPYPDGTSVMSNDYQKYPNTGSDVFSYLNKFSSQPECQDYCNQNSNCTGYLYDNSNKKCVLKNGSAAELLSRMKQN